MSTHQDRPVLRMFLGGVACCCAALTTHPMDTVKVKLQKEGEGLSASKYRNIFRAFYIIAKEEGIPTLYRGLSASLSREATYSTIRLGLYEPFKNLLWHEHTTPLYIKILAGLGSGLTGATIANPFDVIKIRLQAITHKTTMITEFAQIIKLEGIHGLYRGMTPNLIRGAIVTATQLSTYDSIKQVLKDRFHIQEGFKLYFICAFTTGLILTLTTSPIDLMKTRIMSQESGHRIYTGLSDCVIRTLKQEGILAFYKGFLPQWFRFGPFSIIQFIVWEYLRTSFNIRNI